MASDAYDIKVLNALTETVLDSVDGYEEAIKDAGEASYCSVFVEGAAERRAVAAQLQAEVRARGGDADDDGSVLAAAHRVFTGLKDALTNGDEPVLDEVERGEAFLKDKFQSALEDGELSGSARNAVLSAYDAVKLGHDRVLHLRERLRGTAA